MKKSLGPSTLILPLPVWLIGAYDAAGKPNAMPASWAGVCCSQPPAVYFAVRPERYTYACVQARQAFTVNIPGAAQAEVVDYCGLKSGRDCDKFAAAGITAVPGARVDAPCIAEFPLVLECKVVKSLELGTHVMFIGEVLDVSCDDALLNAAGRPDVARLQPFIYSPPDGSYYHVGACLGRAYALGKRRAE